MSSTPKITVTAGSLSRGNFNPADFNSVLQCAATLSREAGEVAVVNSSGGTMYRTSSEKISFPYYGGLRWHAEGTRLFTTSTTPLYLTRPDMVGYPTTKTVSSNILGSYIFVEEGDGPSEVTIEGLCDEGLTSTPATASRRWVGTQIMANRVTLRDFRTRNDSSSVISSSNKFPYKSLSDRGVLRYTGTMIGQPRIEEFDPMLARSVNDVLLEKLELMGEPLKQQSQTVTAFGGVHIRKAYNVTIDGVKTGQFVSPADRLIYDVIFTSNPANNDTIIVNDWNPFTRQYTQVTYTFKTTPTTGLHVLRGSTAAETATNLALAVSANNVRAGGSYFAEGLAPGNSRYLGDSSIAACRIQQGDISVTGLTTVGFVPFFDEGSLSNSGLYVVIGTGSYGSAREVNDGQRQLEYATFAIWMEDCGSKQVQNIFPGCSVFESPILTTSTMEYLNLAPSEFSEGGHDNYDNIVGDGCQYTGALLDMRGSGFTVLGDRINPGQCGGLAHPAQPSALAKFTPGTHREWLLDLTTSNASNGDALYIEDGAGNSATFTFKTTPDTVKITFGSVPTDGAILNVNYRGTNYSVRFQKGGGSGGSNSGVVDTSVATTTTLCASHTKSILNALTGASTLFAYTASNAYTNSGELAVTASSSSSAITVTTAPKEILIGASTSATLQAFRRAVQYQCDTLGLNAFVSTLDSQGSGTYRVVVYFYTDTGAYLTWPRMRFTSGGTNFTCTKHHQPYRPSIITSRMDPHWVWDGAGGRTPTLYVEDCYTTVKAEVNTTNAYPSSLAASCQERFRLLLSGSNPADGDKITIKPSASGTAQVFTFRNTITSDTVPTEYQVKRDGSSFVTTIYNLVDKINSISAAGTAAYVIADGLGAVQTNVYLLKGHPELDSSYVALTTNVGAAFVSATRLSTSAWFQLTGIPADDAYIQVTATSGGTNYRFTFKAGQDTDASPIFYINTTTYSTVEAAAERLKNQINNAMGSVAGVPVAAWSGGGIVYINVATDDLAVSENGDSGSAITVNLKTPSWMQGRHNPAVFVGCTNVELTNSSSSLLAIPNYSETTGQFAQNYFGLGNMDNGMNYLPSQFFHVEQKFYQTVTLASAPSNSEVWIVTQLGEVGKFILKTGGGTDANNKWHVNTTTFSTATTAAAELCRLINYAMGGLYASNVAGVVTIHGLLGGDSITDPTDTGNVVTIGTITVWDSNWKVLVRGTALQGKTATTYGDTHTPTMTLPWGAGRTGNSKLYDLGSNLGATGTAPNLTVANIVVPSGSNYVNGATV